MNPNFRCMDIIAVWGFEFRRLQIGRADAAVRPPQPRYCFGSVLPMKFSKSYFIFCSSDCFM
jgi:hypothetical protein